MKFSDNQLSLNFGTNACHLPQIAARFNEQVRAIIGDIDGWPGNCLCLYGTPSSGRNHILQGFLEEHPAVFGIKEAENMEESQLLSLLTQSEHGEIKLILTSNLPPNSWPRKSADLKSRLNAIVALDCDKDLQEYLPQILASLSDYYGIRLKERNITQLISQYIHSFAILEVFEEFLRANADNIFALNGNNIIARFADFQSQTEADLFDTE